MNRRTFLKQASGYALAVAGTMTGVEKVFAELIPAKKGSAYNLYNNTEQRQDFEHRNLGGMDVSADIKLFRNTDGCDILFISSERNDTYKGRCYYASRELELKKKFNTTVFCTTFFAVNH